MYLGIVFVANGVAEDKWVATLLSMTGGKTYTLMRDLSAPTKPAKKNLKDLKEALQIYFKLKPAVIAECFQFHQQNQEPGEFVVECEAEMCRLAASCKFRDYLPHSGYKRSPC